MKNAIFFALPILVAIALAVLLLSPTTTQNIATLIPQRKQPELLFHEVRIAEITLGKKIWTIEAQQAALDNNQINFLNSETTFFKEATPTILIKSPTALLKMKTREFEINEPRCQLLEKPQGTISAQFLTWTKDHKLTLKGDVIFTSGSSILKGKTGEYWSEKQEGQLTEASLTRKIEGILINLIAPVIEYNSKGIHAFPTVKIKRGSTTLTAKEAFVIGDNVRLSQNIELVHEDIKAVSKQLSYVSQPQKALLKGDCRIKKGTTSILGETITIWLKEKRIQALGTDAKPVKLSRGPTILTAKEALLIGDDLKVSQNVKLVYEDINASANRANYLAQEQKIILNGNCKAQKGTDLLAGETIIIWLKDKRIETSGTKGSINKDKTGPTQNIRTKVRMSSEILFKH